MRDSSEGHFGSFSTLAVYVGCSSLRERERDHSACHSVTINVMATQTGLSMYLPTEPPEKFYYSLEVSG